jgi:hypothetical protein
VYSRRRLPWLQSARRALWLQPALQVLWLQSALQVLWLQSALQVPWSAQRALPLEAAVGVEQAWQSVRARTPRA